MAWILVRSLLRKACRPAPHRHPTRPPPHPFNTLLQMLRASQRLVIDKSMWRLISQLSSNTLDRSTSLSYQPPHILRWHERGERLKTRKDQHHILNVLTNQETRWCSRLTKELKEWQWNNKKTNPDKGKHQGRKPTSTTFHDNNIIWSKLWNLEEFARKMLNRYVKEASG